MCKVVLCAVVNGGRSGSSSTDLYALYTLLLIQVGIIIIVAALITRHHYSIYIITVYTL